MLHWPTSRTREAGYVSFDRARGEFGGEPVRRCGNDMQNARAMVFIPATDDALFASPLPRMGMASAKRQYRMLCKELQRKTTIVCRLENGSGIKQPYGSKSTVM